MTRVLSLALIAVAILGATAPGAWAQPAAPPVPQVTITGFIDTITSWNKNLDDSLAFRSGERDWYARNRGRFDVIGQLGQAKAVLGIEIDSTWGTASVGGQDTSVALGTNTGGAQHNGATSAFDINTDTQGSMEVKWLYTEFPLPLTPFPIIARVGAQPFAVQYKQAAYANGDFAGVNLDFLFTPNLKGHLTYVAIEDNLTGSRRSLGFGRGDDWAMIASVEVTPIKGLDIRPIYSFVQIVGSTSTSVRSTTIGGIGGSPSFTRSAIGGVPGLGLYENRHTIGVDARWRSGPFSLDPTFFYQFGTRDTDNPFGPAINSNVRQADISAFFADIIGGWRLGPLLLEARATYVSGNRPKDQLSKDVNYYQPLDNDSGFYGAGWGEIYSLGIDYFIGQYKGLGNYDSLERYGRQSLAARAIYSLTPSLDLRGVVHALWTAKAIDTDGTTAFAGGTGATNAAITCATHSTNNPAQPRGAGCNGDSSYVGTEVNLGLTWRFAPGLSFDFVGAVLFAGDALDSSEVLNGVLTKRDAKNIYSVVSRVRYSF